MNMQRQFRTTDESSVRELGVIGKMLADFVRTVQLIETDIAAEEERARISDRSDAKYPILARTLIERRDNLKVTITALERRLTERAQHEQVATAAQTSRCRLGSAVTLTSTRAMAGDSAEETAPHP
jgi:hypothetical protein